MRLTKADNLGLGLIVLGLLPQVGSLGAAIKLVAVWVLVQLAGATVAQLLARAAARRRGSSHDAPSGSIDGLLAMPWSSASPSGRLVVRETLPAIIGFIAYGLLLAWSGPVSDRSMSAMTEAAIGGGVTGVMLLRAAAALRRPCRCPRIVLASLLRVLVGAPLRCRVTRTGRRRPDAARRPPPTLAHRGREASGRTRTRQSRHGGADRLSRARHLAGKGRACSWR